MFAALSPFLDFNLPNPTTWFYFSFLLAVALFFKFGRLFSIRNLDVVSLFLLMPAIMIIQVNSPPTIVTQRHAAVQAAQLVGQGGAATIGSTPVVATAVERYASQRLDVAHSARLVWLGYLWLLIGSLIFFARCVFDLALVQRPALEPNLTFGGLGWFGLTLLVCLSAVAFRQQDSSRLLAPQQVAEGIPNPQRKTGPESAPVVEARRYFAATDLMMCGVAIVGQLTVVLGLMMMGRLHFQDATAGLAAAVFYLLLPYTGMFVGQAAHVWPMAILVWALVAYRYPAVSGFLIGLATGPFYYPVVLLPVMVSFYWNRGVFRFLASFLLSLALVMGGVALAFNMRGELQESVRRAFDLAAWQPWKTPPADLPGFWTGIHAAYRIPVFIAYAAFVLATAFWPSPKNLGHVLALASAALIGTQFWYADQGGIYVLWYLPLLLLMVFRPNLEDRRPPLIDRETDWIYRFRAFLMKPLQRLLRSEELTKVQ